MLVSRLHVPCKVQLNYDFVTAAAAAALSFCAFSSFDVVVVAHTGKSACVVSCTAACPFRNSRRARTAVSLPDHTARRAPRYPISREEQPTQWKSMRATAPDLRQCAHAADASWAGCCVFSWAQQHHSRVFTLFSENPSARAESENPARQHSNSELSFFLQAMYVWKCEIK